MPLFHDDDERTRDFKDLFREYLTDPNPNAAHELSPYVDILVKAGIEVLFQNIREMSVQIYDSPTLKTPSRKFTAFGSNWIESLQDLLTTLGLENANNQGLIKAQLLELLRCADQDLSALAALQFCIPLFTFSDEISEQLVTVYHASRGNGRRLAIAFAILKVKLDPEPFETEIIPRLPPEITPGFIQDEYSKLAKLTSNIDMNLMKVAVLDRLLASFLMQIVILDIGFGGLNWKAVWSEWTREEEV